MFQPPYGCWHYSAQYGSSVLAKHRQQKTQGFGGGTKRRRRKIWIFEAARSAAGKKIKIVEAARSAAGEKMQKVPKSVPPLPGSQ